MSAPSKPSGTPPGRSPVEKEPTMTGHRSIVTWSSTISSGRADAVAIALPMPRIIVACRKSRLRWMRSTKEASRMVCSAPVSRTRIAGAPSIVADTTGMLRRISIASRAWGTCRHPPPNEPAHALSSNNASPAATRAIKLIPVGHGCRATGERAPASGALLQDITDFLEQNLAAGRRRRGLLLVDHRRDQLDQPEDGEGDDNEVEDRVDEHADIDGRRAGPLRVRQRVVVLSVQREEDVAEVDPADRHAEQRIEDVLHEAVDDGREGHADDDA